MDKSGKNITLFSKIPFSNTVKCSEFSYFNKHPHHIAQIKKADGNIPDLGFI